ncbi:MAG: D-2-hydroxyacid dehydrogenase [Hyphomicrobiales bacterium]|nr:D-2-hydroxyacid dehydrogenase [Hyphomicrobiales bacterium]
MLPAKDDLTICFAHVAYQLQARFEARKTGLRSFEVRAPDELSRRIGEADVLVVSGMWKNELLEKATKLKFIQSIGSGVDQFAQDKLRASGVRLANAQGVNARAVAEHAMALMLALMRRLPEARDNQGKHHWRAMIGDLARREDELSGKTLLVIGLGTIGNRLAKLAKAFDMHVTGFRRDPAIGRGHADEVHAIGVLGSFLPRADFVALTCPLTKQTENLIDSQALRAMKPSAFLVNVARGRCVDEAALVEALAGRRIAGAGIDVTQEEPLAAASPLWGMEQVLLTPHTAGETRAYEDTILDYLCENLGRLWRGETRLHNEIV